MRFHLASARRSSPAHSRRSTALVLLLGMVLAGCSDAGDGEPVHRESRDGAPEGEAPNPGAPPGTGAAGPGSEPAAPAAGAPGWLQPAADCPPGETTIYVTGLMLDMSTGEAECERSVVVCGDSLKSERLYDSDTESCPWSDRGRTAITFSEKGPRVCCRDWEAAKLSKVPCDPQLDADCDGIANDEDLAPLTPASPAV